ncbi:MAG: hypothetical protein IJ877_07525 [Candidatus Gastranaerophilales bacterium]|nr:hypothetical protein [Candidatus Gastranaerophilales bacterium]
MDNYKGTIKYIGEIAKDTYKMGIISDLKQIKAGQFVSVLCPNKTLRRPFSASGFENGILSILFKLRGEGTEYLKNLKYGNNIDFLAPLGNGFDIKNKKSLLIGAGIGIAPMLFLKNELNKRNIENYLISGFKEVGEIVKGSDETIVGGSVLDNIENLIEKFKPEIIYSCGPSIVLKLVSELGIKKSIETQVALERVMACSIGVCRGCVIKLIKNNELTNASVCKDGPVFKGDEVVW